MHLHSGDAGEKQTPRKVPVWGPCAKGRTQRNLGASVHQPIPGRVVGRQRAAIRVEQEDQLHQDRRGVGLLGSKVEHRHDVALIVTAHRESDPGGQRALVREDHVTEEERARISKAAILRLGSPFLNGQGYSSTWICSWNQYTSFFSGSILLEHHPPTNASPSSEALASLQPHQEDFGK